LAIVDFRNRFGKMQSKIENREPKILEWVVLSPEDRQRRRSALESVFKFVALLMDRLIRIPGIKKRLGLNPILDLVPGFGDIATALVSLSVLIYGIRRGVPKILLGRMALNVLLNEVVGIIPVVGSIFAFWFTANTRNFELLREHLDTPRRSTTGDKIFVTAVLGTVVLVILAGIAGTFWIFHEIAELIANG
jgi:Domain of unknown function (DUF4112)